MTTPIESSQILKLPKWAQEHIHDLQRQRDVAVRALNAASDNSTPSPFYYEDHICTGESTGPKAKRFYIQAHAVLVEWRGVRLSVDANDYGNTGSGIRIQWDRLKRSCQSVAFIPVSYQCARLVSKEDMD